RPPMRKQAATHSAWAIRYIWTAWARRTRCHGQQDSVLTAQFFDPLLDEFGGGPVPGEHYVVCRMQKQRKRHTWAQSSRPSEVYHAMGGRWVVAAAGKVEHLAGVDHQ